jgi:predicted DNA binding CopG/RHH family protein
MAKKFTPPTLKHYPKMFEFLDDEERALIESIERGEWKPIKNMKKELAELRTAAENYMLKKERINIRISRADLQGIKQCAQQEGLPYQTLIASLIHKYQVERLGK